MKLRRFLTLVAAMLMTCACLYADSGTRNSVQFQVIVQTEPNQNPEDEDPEGIRMPGKSIVGTIDIENGIHIPGLDKSQVTSYQVYTDNECLGVWYNEPDFIMQLSELEGPAEIRINFSGCYLSAWIDLPL